MVDRGPHLSTMNELAWRRASLRSQCVRKNNKRIPTEEISMQRCAQKCFLRSSIRSALPDKIVVERDLQQLHSARISAHINLEHFHVSVKSWRKHPGMSITPNETQFQEHILITEIRRKAKGFSSRSRRSPFNHPRVRFDKTSGSHPFGKRCRTHKKYSINLDAATRDSTLRLTYTVCQQNTLPLCDALSMKKKHPTFRTSVGQIESHPPHTVPPSKARTATYMQREERSIERITRNNSKVLSGGKRPREVPTRIITRTSWSATPIRTPDLLLARKHKTPITRQRPATTGVGAGNQGDDWANLAL